MTIKDIEEKIQKLIKRCETVPNEEIVQLSNYQILKNVYAERNKSVCDVYLVLAIIFGLLALSMSGVTHVGIKPFLRYTYDKFLSIDLDFEPCLAPKFEVMIDVFRPPHSCDICRNFEQIERRSNITREEFEEKYAYTNRPVIITDAMNDWLALDKFDFEFFQLLYRSNSSALRAVEEHCQFFPYKNADEFDSLGDVFAMDLDRAHMTDENYRPWYVGWSNCDYSTAYLLRQYYTRPYFLPQQSESSKLDWIFMGTPGLGAHMHVDNVDLPSWQAQVRGRKRWILRPVPECYFQCRELDLIVEPGEIIVLNTNVWYHKTSVISENEISITIGSEFD